MTDAADAKKSVGGDKDEEDKGEDEDDNSGAGEVASFIMFRNISAVEKTTAVGRKDSGDDDGSVEDVEK